MNIQHIHGVAPLYTNTFLIITNAKHGILIDAAAEPGVYLKALDEAGATLTHILLTHGHYDHVGAVAALKKATQGNKSFGYTDEEIVSSDVIGSHYGSVFDATQTEVSEAGELQLVKAVAWYDNEYGYSNMVVRMLQHMYDVDQAAQAK